MQIATKIENTGGRYRVEIGTQHFSALEDQKLAEFGEPQIDVGSVIAGAASRPGEINTTCTIADANGTEATGVVSVNASGVITGVTITTPGSGYTAPTITFSGDGSGAAATVQHSGGAVTGVTITDGGEGYSSVPHTVTFTLPPALRLIRRDFPIVAIFDLSDNADADVRAKVYADVISARLSAAKSALISQNSPFEGEFVTTI